MKNLIYLFIFTIFMSCDMQNECSKPILDNENIILEEVVMDSENDIILENNTIDTIAPSNVFEIGEITYIVNDTMFVGEVTTINLLISKSLNDTDINEIFKKNEVFTTQIPITKKMKVELIDPTHKYFDIHCVSEITLPIDNITYTQWQWDVIPKKIGESKLKLIISIVTDDTPRILKVYENMINVYTHETKIQKTKNFFIDNWKYIISSILLPLLFFIYKRKKK